MAIFTAGCIEATDSVQKIRNSVYDLAKHDLDSPAMKMSVRKSSTCVNFIAFLPKEKLTHENILKAVSECDQRTVIVFEIDYKHVGIVCEYQRIVDYILDKPEEFAQERGYETRFVDNADGVKLVSFNLDKNSREAWAGSVSLGFTILLTTLIFYSGYYYVQDIPINKGNQMSLETQYKLLVKKEFKRSAAVAKKVDLVKRLEDVEKLTKETNARLLQAQYNGKDFCVAVETLETKKFVNILPANTVVKYQNDLEGKVEYCYEKI